ncbi:SMC-Scp complex subunit ScpB [Anaerococcus sp. AGMB09787]|uniref:SMC-Scp complex subunit ScpB n=1 Tax=Anaerococcus sp. AGMB09787 TaxID=2922869 RepID=UPI001FAEB37E|nr:SMC-Scp complex subunit ScpB [Anaerococcus sp. AGMB09787]
MDKNYLKGLIEEVLYIWADPIDIDDLSKIIYDYEKKDIEEALIEIKNERDERPSGLVIRDYNKAYKFTTRDEHNKYFEKVVKKSEKKLSSSALETLSIIAYKQPITRAEVDKIRGVNSQSSIDTLLDKDLIEERGRLDKIGKPIIYGTNTNFLEYFNISSLDDLPEIDFTSEEEDED